MPKLGTCRQQPSKAAAFGIGVAKGSHLCQPKAELGRMGLKLLLDCTSLTSKET